MKQATLLGLIFLSVQTGLRAQSFEQLLAQGKSEFKSRNFSEAVTTLESAVQLNPQNSEAHYFLGYSYARLNASDANDITSSSTELTIKSSKEFETINQLTPKYTGEFVILDPYSKITAEWGSAALKYLYNNKKDSAIWALTQGKARGGFGDFFMNYNRFNLEHCGKNAFLFLSGDNYTFYTLYLQLVEEYRTDVKAIDVAMLGSWWYPKLLSQNYNVKFDKSDSEIDSISYIEWKETLVQIGKYKWTVKPSYKNDLLRDDILFLSILRENKLMNEVCFIGGFDNEDKLNLETMCYPNLSIDKLSQIPIEFNSDSIINGYKRYLNLSNFINPNSKMEVLNFGTIQLRALEFICQKYVQGDKSQAQILLNIFDNNLNQYNGQITRDDVRKYYIKTLLLFYH